MTGQYVTRATVQRVESSEGLVFRGILASRFLKTDGSYSDGGTIDNLPVEIFFSQDRRTARIAVGYKPEGDVAYRRDALEYSFQTKSGVMLGDWGENDESEGYQINISYEGISFDGKDVTYWYFQDDATDTEVLMQHGNGVSVGSYTKDEPPVATYTELDRSGNTVDGEPADSQKTEIAAFASNLTNERANQELTRIMNAATLDGPIFDELLVIQNEKVQW